MIIREWAAMAQACDGEACPRDFRDHGVLDHSTGLRGAHLSRRQTGERMERRLLTHCQSLHTASAAAGRTLLASGAAAVVIDCDATVAHREMIEDVTVT